MTVRGGIATPVSRWGGWYFGRVTKTLSFYMSACGSKNLPVPQLRWVPKHPAISLPNAVTPQIMDMAASRLSVRERGLLLERGLSCESTLV